MTTDREMIDKLKARLTELESKKDFDLTSPFYLALKEKIDKLNNVIEK